MVTAAPEGTVMVLILNAMFSAMRWMTAVPAAELMALVVTVVPWGGSVLF